MRAATLKAGAAGVAGLVGYYAGLAEDHLRRDGLSRGPIDYYLDPNEPPGRWWGRGAPAVDLSGTVRPEQLEAMLHACDPGPGGGLGRTFGAKSARAFDATFSAPKSVSVLWALSPDAGVQAEVLAAHDAAVVAALDWLEQHGGVTRRGRNGVHQVDTRGLVAALFRQHTSRDVDPQLHTHAVIWAKVQDPAGKWLSLDARFLKQQQRSIGWIYAASLRSELSARLGVSWGPVCEGHADMEDVPAELLTLFSQRNAQVEARLAEAVAAWVDDHDGAEPDPRTLYRLERNAVLDSRPEKAEPIPAGELRGEWRARAQEAGFDPLAVPPGTRRLRSSIRDDEVIGQALEAVAASSSSWLRADLAREISARLPAAVAGSATEVVRLVDELAERAYTQCVELHPPPRRGAACRGDGRPVTEHVVDRLLSTAAVLDQEARLLRWARANGAPRPSAPDDGRGAQAVAAREVADYRRLVLVVGPAGTGKTTMLARAVADLRDKQRAVVGLAPSGKAADVLGRETGSTATTLAKLLHEYGRVDGPQPKGQLQPGTTLILDEAGMASSDDLARMTALADLHEWRVVCVGDPAQLPAVGRGGMFAHWCATLPAHHLDEVRRFADAWQAEASLLLREGDPAAAMLYAQHQRLRTVHPTLVADRVARQFEQQRAGGAAAVAITTASTGTARAIKVEIQRRNNLRQEGPSVALADGTSAFVGDRVATRRNDGGLVASGGSAVRNRQTWTVTAIDDDGSLTLADSDRGSVRLPARYVSRHVELGWAVTGYGNQGTTVDHGICVIEPASTRAGIYVAMTRGRGRNVAWIVDRNGTDDAEGSFAAAIARPPNAGTAHAVRDRLHRAAGVVPPDPAVPMMTDDDPARRMAERLSRLPVPARRPPSLKV